MKFYKIQNWDYLDEFPTTQVMVFANEAKAKEYVYYMQSAYSGGTTKLLGELDSVEAANYVRHLYNVEKEHKKEDSHDFLLNAAIKYKECYGKEVISAQELIEF